MNILVSALFACLNAIAVKNDNPQASQAWLNNQADFEQELADVLEYGVQGTNFSWFWLTTAILKDEDVLMCTEFDDIINDYQGRLNFALFLGSDDVINCLDKCNYDGFVAFHNYFWTSVAELAFVYETQ